MPSLGADMQAGTLVVWHKQPGERVVRGDIVAEVETEKGIIEVESYIEGVVQAHLVAPGPKVPVGTKLAVLADAAPAQRPIARTSAAEAPATVSTATAPSRPRDAGAQATPSARRLLRERGITHESVHGTGEHGVITRADALAAASQAPAVPAAIAPSLPSPAFTGGELGARLRVSPRARRLARELDISLMSVKGTGPDGAIVAADVERAQREHAQAAPSASSRMRAAIAQAMARSKREIPHYYLTHTVDLGPALAWLAEQNEKRALPERLLPGILFVRAVARAVREVPELNGHYVDDTLRLSEAVHVGLAVSLRGGGLIAPALLDAQARSLDDLARAFKDLVNRARTGRVTSSEMGSATLTITSLGERGVETVFPVIVPPQVAMVGFGAVIQKPMVVGDAVLARPTVTITLAADHRVSDGHRGGLFLSAVAAALQEPSKP